MALGFGLDLGEESLIGFARFHQRLLAASDVSEGERGRKLGRQRWCVCQRESRRFRRRQKEPIAAAGPVTRRRRQTKSAGIDKQQSSLFDKQSRNNRAV
eukprot:1032097-Rhodomonas_salina.3